MRQEKREPKKCSVCGNFTTDIRKVGTTYAYTTDKTLLNKYMCFECTYQVWLEKGIK